ncbi:F0F1 ATP synthase subunit B [Patescibacteria group bacterium]|nr:F0F1 ATP synthase subunit B [Patescibacteria group bacterium]MBU1754682.1 F0F1 ATP synthase subunit B [Patescibacteria group bacterium]
MEQLFSTFGIDVKLILAQAVNFAVLFAVLTYFLYKPVLKTLDERRAKVAKGVEDADKAAEALAHADEEAKSRIGTAETEAEGIVSQARETAGTEKTRIVKEAEARAEALQKDAEARAQEAADKALRDSEKEIARLAILAAEKAMQKS